MGHFVSGTLIRDLLFRLQKGTCALCRKPCGLDTPSSGGKADQLMFTIDHIVPLSRGGKWTAMNIRGCCLRCNSLKADGMEDPEVELEIEELAPFLKGTKPMQYKIVVTKEFESVKDAPVPAADGEGSALVPVVTGGPAPKTKRVTVLTTSLDEEEFNRLRKGALAAL